MDKICKKDQHEEKYIDFIIRVINQFFKCFLILAVIFVLTLIRKSMQRKMNIGICLAYCLLACVGMVCIYIADSYAYNNILVGLGAYFGFVLLNIT